MMAQYVHLHTLARVAKIVFVTSHANSFRIETTPVLFHYLEIRNCDYYADIDNNNHS